MTPKEYLKQAYYLDKCINSKLSQITILRTLATKCTTTFTDMPRKPNKNSTMADILDRLIDLETELSKEIDEFVDLKLEIEQVIKKVDNPEYQILLEMRYLGFRTWGEIANDMNYGIDNVYRIHRKALDLIEIPKTIQ